QRTDQGGRLLQSPRPPPSEVERNGGGQRGGDGLTASAGEPLSFRGQTALVTGASRGLGRAIARRLGQEGAAVCVNYGARESEAEAAVSEIRSAGTQAIAVRADIGDPAQVQRMVDRAAAELGPVSILVNNAGVSLRGTLETFDPRAMDRMRRTNVD